MKKLALVVLCGMLAGCAVTNHTPAGLRVDLPCNGESIVHLDECAYSEELKEFICPSSAVHSECSEIPRSKLCAHMARQMEQANDAYFKAVQKNEEKNALLHWGDYRSYLHVHFLYCEKPHFD
jgi:hypothetical protein